MPRGCSACPRACGPWVSGGLRAWSPSFKTRRSTGVGSMDRLPLWGWALVGAPPDRDRPSQRDAVRTPPVSSNLVPWPSPSSAPPRPGYRARPAASKSAEKRAAKLHRRDPHTPRGRPITQESPRSRPPCDSPASAHRKHAVQRLYNQRAPNVPTCCGYYCARNGPGGTRNHDFGQKITLFLLPPLLLSYHHSSICVTFLPP